MTLTKPKTQIPMALLKVEGQTLQRQGQGLLSKLKTMKAKSRGLKERVRQGDPKPPINFR